MHIDYEPALLLKILRNRFQNENLSYYFIIVPSKK